MSTHHYDKHDERAIVDPSVWESTEVGGAEGIAFHSDDVKRSKVSSMRSSLFQRRAKEGNETDHHTQAFHHSLIFQQASDAESIQSEFSFEGRKSLAFCVFGKPNKKIWPRDVLAFFHNAIRYEIHDLMTVMQAVQRIGCKLTVGHLVNIRVWWQTCDAIILDYLDMEAKVLEPWIAIALDGYKGDVDQAMKVFQGMPRRQQQIRSLIESISGTFSELCDESRSAESSDVKSLSQKTMLLMGSLDALVVETTTYLYDQEETFCKVLVDKYKGVKKDREVLMGKGIKQFVKKGRKRDFMLVLLTRWMGDSKAMVSNVNALIEELHDCDLTVITSRYENSHASLVRQLVDECRQ